MRLTSISLAVALTVGGCGQAQVESDDAPRGEGGALGRAASAGSARYFGYFGSHYIGADIGCDDAQFNDHTNVAWLAAFQPSELPPQIQAAARCGKKSILAVQGIFWGAGNDALLADPEGRADALAAALRGELPDVVALFTIDEPFIPAAGHGPGWKAQRLADIERVHALLKARLPGLPLAVNFSAPELQPHPAELPRIPAQTDWVGFDCYLDAGTFESCAGHPIQHYVDYLKARMTGAQRLFFIPPAFVPVSAPDACATHAFDPAILPPLEAFVDSFTALAEREPLVVGIFPYVWTSYCGDSDRWYTATKDLPTIQSRFRAQGLAVIAPHPAPAMAVDTPAGNASVAAGFVVAGWATDLGALTGSGVDTIHVWAHPASGAAPIFLGVAAVGGERPDVASLFGPHSRFSGFSLTTGPLEAGTYDVVVYAHSSVSGTFNQSASRRVTLTSEPRMTVDILAASAAAGAPLRIAGWAIDLAAASGSGVNWVDVHALPVDGSAGIYLGPATLGVHRPDVGDAFGAQFQDAGFDMVTSQGLAPGEYDVVVFARSAQTGTFNDSRAVRVTVE